MTAEETQSICADASGAIENGIKDLQLEMFAALVCQ
jgi:hypothetical protein